MTNKKIFKKIFICHIKYVGIEEPERAITTHSPLTPGVTARDIKKFNRRYGV